MFIPKDKVSHILYTRATVTNAKKERGVMAPVKLPCDLEEEILSRLPPLSLVRSRTVCQHWNTLLNDKSFLNKHLSRVRPQFIFLTDSKAYSINIDLHTGGADPTVEVHEEPSDFPYQAIDLTHNTSPLAMGFFFVTFGSKVLRFGTRG